MVGNVRNISFVIKCISDLCHTTRARQDISCEMVLSWGPGKIAFRSWKSLLEFCHLSVVQTL